MEVYEGHDGEIGLDGDDLLLTKKKVFGKDSTRRIPLQALTDLGFKDTGKLSPGWLQLIIAGEEPSKVGPTDPNTVMFLKSHRERWADLHEHLRAVIVRNREQGVDATAVEYDPVQKGKLEQWSDRLEESQQRLGERAEARRQEQEERQVDELAEELARQGITRPDLVAAARETSGWLGLPVELPKLAQLLRPDETVRRMSRGSFNDAVGIIVLTDHRLLLIDVGYWDSSTADFPLSVITSVSASKELFVNRLAIHTTSGQVMEIGNVSDVDSLAAAIREELNRARAAAAQPAAPAPAPDALDQLAKLAALRDAGVVTAEEFEAKKEDLLKRI